MWIVFAHIVCMFVGVALTVGVGIYFSAILRSGDVRVTRAAACNAIPLSTAGGIILIAGAVFGLIAAMQLGYPLTARWLVVSYVLLTLLLLDGFFHRLPWMRRIESAARASADDRSSTELRTLIANRFEAATGPISGLMWLAILVMMTLKP